jgi:N-acetylglucosamine kinase-like BadF-type ATPase
MQPLYLAVDAGGSRTTYVLACGERVLARSESGSIKRIRVSAEVAERHLSEGLSALTRVSGVPLSDVVRTCVGTAGESIPLVADWIRAAFAEHVGGSLLITSDVGIALDAAFFGGAGVLALAGTGSNVAARTPDGRVTTVGGWGPVLGDPGAGYTIGRQGLRAAFRAVDRGEAPPLLDRLHALWGTTTPVEIMSYVYSAAAPDLATLAPLVAACALDGDEDCAAVLRQNGEDLAQTVLLAIARLQAMGENDLPTVACAGSILGHVPSVREAMTAALQRVHPQVVVLPGVVDPVMGALWQARTLL